IRGGRNHLRANKCPTFQRAFGEIPCENRTGNFFVEPGILFVEPGNCQVRKREISALTRFTSVSPAEKSARPQLKASPSLLEEKGGNRSLAGRCQVQTETRIPNH